MPITYHYVSIPHRRLQPDKRYIVYRFYGESLLVPDHRITSFKPLAAAVEESSTQKDPSRLSGSLT